MISLHDTVRSLVACAIAGSFVSTSWSAGNLAPKVTLTAPANHATFSAPATLVLKATATDADGTIARVEFFNGATKLGESTNAPFQITWPSVAAGTYGLTAKATDNAGLTANSAAISVVVDEPPSITLTAPANGSKFNAPAAILLKATATDHDGTIAKVEFFRGTTRIGQTSSAPYQFDWTQVPAGAYTLTAKATDNSGIVAVSAPVTIAVNAPPRIVLSAPASTAKFTAPATIVLVATATDADGTIAKVEFFRGTTKMGEATSAPFQFSWAQAPAGTYTLTARATDDQGAVITSAPVTLRVNMPPVVALTTPGLTGVVLAPATITLQATASDPDGSIAKVEFFRGATKLGESTTPPYQLSWTNAAAGTYTLTAKATDNSGGTTVSAPIMAIVDAPPNIALTAPLSTSKFVAPATLVLKATATDSDGTIAKVEFFNGATKLGQVTMSPFHFTWAAVPAGVYTVTAKATDNVGATATSTPVAITVDAPPVVALTSPSAGSVVSAAATVIVQATASDPDGTIAKVEFYRGTTKLGEATSAPFQFSWTNAAAGTYSLTAKATDNAGAMTTSAPVSLVVNALPKVALTAPVATSKFTAPAAIALKAAASDADGTIAKVEFFNGATKVGECLTTPFQLNWTGVGAGTYALTARATDNRGAATTSAPVTLVVNAPPSVTLTAPAAGAVLHAPASVTLQATASDPDGTIAKVEFFRGTTKLGEATSAPFQFAWANIAAGTYALTAKATDNAGAATSSAPVALVVNALPKVALTAPASTGKFTAPATILLKASPSDSDGTITKVEFYHGTAKLGEATSAPYQYNWTPVAAGTYTLTAKATDNLGGSTTSATVAVLVNAPPSVALTAPAGGTVVSVPANVLLQATASDSDGTIAKVEFFRGTTKLGQATAAPFDFNWMSAPAGTYTLTAKATDNLGAALTSSPVTLIVNALPTVKITTPVNNAKFTAPAAIAILTNAADSDGTVAKVEFFNSAAKIGEALAPPYAVTWSGVTTGNYTLTAKATDNQGAVTTSPAVAVKVAAAPGTPTIAIVTPPDDAVVAATTSIALTALTSGFAHPIAKVELFNGSAKLGEAVAANGQPGSYTLTLGAGLPAGTYSLIARATDNGGAVTNSIASTLIVNASPVVALTAPAAGAMFTAPATVSLAATASDSDGTVAKVEFFLGAAKLGEATTAPYQISAADLPAGNYLFTARATDNRGTVTVSSAVSVRVDSAPTVVLTAPVDGTVVTAPADVTLVATATDADGSIAKVEFFSGLQKLGEATAAPYTIVWSAPPPGVYSVTALAKNNRGGTATSAPIAITVNAPPTVALTAPLNGAVFAGPAAITISASASDRDGTVAKVEFFNGAAKIGEATAAPFQFVWTGVSAGTYALTAKATDDAGGTAVSAAITVQVTVPNAAPTVVLSAPADGSVVGAPGAITLQATATDSDGAVAKVEFFNGVTKLGEATSAPFTFTATGLAAGSYFFTARATDNGGAVTTSAAVNVVVDSLPTVTITAPATGTTAAEFATITISATASDSDGSVVRVEFFSGATQLGEATAAPFQFVWADVAAGNYTLTASATDDVGGNATSAPVTVLVASATNLPPFVTLDAPTDGASIPASTDITVEATAADNDGTITKVEFYNGATKLGESTVAPYQFVWTNVPAGSYQLLARAYDNSAAFTDSLPVSINVTSALAVVLTSPYAGSHLVSPATIDVSADVVVEGGVASKVDFFSGPTLIGESTAAPYQFSWTDVAPGTYTFRARAYDGTGATADSESVTVTVAAPHIPPAVTLSGPAEGSTVLIPTPILLSASASAPSGSVAHVEFSANGMLLGRATTAPYQFTWGLIPAGTYTFLATVFDDSGASATSSALTVIVAAPHSPPVVKLIDPVPGSRFSTLDTVYLAANATAAMGTIAKVEFYQGSTRLAQVATAPFEFAWSGLTAGNYDVTAKAYDDSGASSTTAPVTIQVGVPPTVTLTAPAPGASVTLPATISLSATATTTVGRVAKVEFYQAGTLLGFAAAPPYQINWNGALPGAYTLRARAYGDNGTSADSAPVAIQVDGSFPPVVALTFPEPGLTFALGSSITLLATAQEIGGAIARVDFLQNSGYLTSHYFRPWEDPSVPAGADIYLGNAGTFALTARAFDAAEVSAESSPVTLTVTTTPPPVVSLQATPLTTRSVSLVATASAATGTITKVELYAGGAPLASSPSTPLIYEWNGIAPGSYSLRARAYDSVGGVSVSAPISFTAYAGLPYLANFEASENYALGSLAGMLGWSVTETTAEVTASDAFSGSRSVVVQPSPGQRQISQATQADAAPSIVFVDFMAKPVADSSVYAASLFASAGTRIGVQLSGHHGVVLVLSSLTNGDSEGTWIDTLRTLPLNPDGQAVNWVRFTQRLDYQAHTWDLYLDGQMIIANVAMDSSVTQPGVFSVRGHQTSLTRFDDVYLGADNPLFQDTAHDGIDDAWKIAHGLNPAVYARDLDPAESGLTVIQKYVLGLDPQKLSTLNDGIPDGWKMLNGLDPLSPWVANYDPHGDGLTWRQKYSLRNLFPVGAPLNPLQDSDGDGVPDLIEFAAGTDPFDYFNGEVPVMTPLADYSSQFGPNGSIAAIVKDSHGRILVNAPVTFTTTPGNLLTTNPYGRGQARTLTVRSDQRGVATVYVRPAR